MDFVFASGRVVRRGAISALCALALGCVLGVQSRAQVSAWSVYQNEAFRYELAYPTGWEIIEAKPRVNNLSAWEGSILLEGELQKVTFLERGSSMWPGEFQIRVLANPGNRRLEDWIDRDELKDVSGGSSITAMADDKVGGRPAKRLELFLFDHRGIELITLHQNRVYILRFAGKNPNDPEETEHRAIYEYMASDFQFVP